MLQVCLELLYVEAGEWACASCLTYRVVALTLARRGSGGAAHARGVWGVSPSSLQYWRVGAEQRESDAQQAWHALESRRKNEGDRS